MKKNVLILLFVLSFAQNVKGQAYDGQGDFKIFGGYTNVGGKSGVDIQIDFGLGDLVSLGLKLTTLIKPDDREVLDSFDITFQKAEAIDYGSFVRFHFSEPLNLSEKLDPYLGFDITFKSLGPHIGFKYNFSEYVGTYVHYSQSISTSLTGDHVVNGDTYGHYTDNINYFGNKAGISFGLTVNIF